MRKIVRNIVLFALVAFCLTGCSRTCDYPFLHPVEEIVDMRIGIVRARDSDAGDFLADGAKRLETLAVLSPEQQAVLLERFASVPCWKMFGEPINLPADSTVIYIAYQNGDFEFASFFGQYEYYNERQYYSQNSLYYLDKYAFNALIEKTLAEIEAAE